MKAQRYSLDNSLGQMTRDTESAVSGDRLFYSYGSGVFPAADMEQAKSRASAPAWVRECKPGDSIPVKGGVIRWEVEA